MITVDDTAWCVGSTIKIAHWFDEQVAVIHVTRSGDLHLVSHLARKILELLSNQPLGLEALFLRLRPDDSSEKSSPSKDVLESQLHHLLHLGVVRKVQV